MADPISTNIPHHHEGLDTHAPLHVFQERFGHLGKLPRIPDPLRGIKIKVGVAGSRGCLPLLLIIWGAFLIPFLYGLLHICPFLLAKAFYGFGHSLGVGLQIWFTPHAAFKSLDAWWD